MNTSEGQNQCTENNTKPSDNFDMAVNQNNNATIAMQFAKGVSAGKQHGDGFYVRGSVGGVPVVITADTGATKTIVSKRVYNRMSTAEKPILKGSVNLVGANGTSIKELGMGGFRLMVGPAELECEAVVAEIKDDVLLGYDVLGSETNGPADILIRKRVMVINGVEIPCIGKHTGKPIRIVTVADDVTVPGESEALIDVFIERQESDDVNVGDFIVEPIATFKDTHKLLMATTLVNVNAHPTCKVRVLNPFSHEVRLRQNMQVAQAEEAEDAV